MKNVSKIILIICIVIIIISLGIVVFKYIQGASINELGKENLLEKYTPLENLTSDDFELKSCVGNNYYTLVTAAKSIDSYHYETNDFVVYNKEELDNFITNVNSNIPDEIRIIQYTIDEKESFLKNIKFTKDKFIIENDYRWFGGLPEEDRKIITNEYNAKDYKLIIDTTPIINEGSKTYYKVYLASNNNSDFIYLCNYFEIPENNESNFELEFIKYSSNERQLILSKTENTQYDYDIYSYNGDVNIIINNETFTLRDALLSNKITVEEILDKAIKDVEKYRNALKFGYADGGSIEYFYNDYIILKYNQEEINKNGTFEYNKDMYIGDISMDKKGIRNKYYASSNY